MCENKFVLESSELWFGVSKFLRTENASVFLGAIFEDDRIDLDSKP